MVSSFDGATLNFTSIESRLSKTLRHYKAELKLELLCGSVENTIKQAQAEKNELSTSIDPLRLCLFVLDAVPLNFK